MEGMDVEAVALERCRNSLPIFGAQCLKILTKGGKTEPLAMNRAQSYVHQRLEEQLKKTGKVRALILKGRQQGISTYVAARFYWRTSFNFGRKAFIVAHEDKATANLFKMVKRYHDHNLLAPSTGFSNAQELVFDTLDSGYALATAKTDAVGRSHTVQYLHGSEFAFWRNAQEHLAGIGNTVPDADDTEIIFESTGNGLGTPFHEMWQSAEAGEGEYIAIFVPWFWQSEYTATVPEKFVLSKEDIKYQAAFKLTLGQMAWRANKISSYGTGKAWLFDQEFPATPSLAFQSPTSNPYMPPSAVAAAANSTFYEEYGPLIIGADPAGGGVGGDRFALVWRRGRVVYQLRKWTRKNTMQSTGLLAKILDEDKPEAMFIDKNGIGAGVYDRLRELGYGNVFGIMSGAAASDDKLYANKKAEMAARGKEWLEDEPNRIPNDPEFVADLCAVGQTDPSSNGREQIESKASMRKRGVRSPDYFDAFTFTFAETPSGESLGDNRGGNAGHAPATKAGY